MHDRVDPRVHAAELTKLAAVMRSIQRPDDARRARDDAIILLRAAAERDPDDAALRSVLGVRLAEAGRTDDAIEHLEAAAVLRPDSSEAHSNLGLVYARAGRAGDAIKCYEQAIRLDPDNASAHYNLGLLQENLQRVDDARASYRRALEADATHRGAAEALRRLRAGAPSPARDGEPTQGGRVNG